MLLASISGRLACTWKVLACPVNIMIIMMIIQPLYDFDCFSHFMTHAMMVPAHAMCMYLAMLD